MTIDEIVKLQANMGLGDAHLVWLGETGFAIAHTNAERYLAKADGDMALTDCPLHLRLAAMARYMQAPPQTLGVFVVKDDTWTEIDLRLAARAPKPITGP